MRCCLFHVCGCLFGLQFLLTNTNNLNEWGFDNRWKIMKINTKHTDTPWKNNIYGSRYHHVGLGSTKQVNVSTEETQSKTISNVRLIVCVTFTFPLRLIIDPCIFFYQWIVDSMRYRFNFDPVLISTAGTVVLP